MSGALVATSLHHTGRRSEFLVVPLVEGVGEALISMGFRPSTGGLARTFDASPAIPRIFANFARHIDEMVAFKMGCEVTPWETALATVVERFGGRLDWWLTGSAALAVRGIDVVPRDIDLVVADAGIAGRLLSDLVVEPVSRMPGWIADWFGRAFSGALIEWVADVHADVDADGPHEQGPAAAARREAVVWRGHQILCAPLELQLAVARARGVRSTVTAIERFQADRR